jgi:hypothetical protein
LHNELKAEGGLFAPFKKLQPAGIRKNQSLFPIVSSFCLKRRADIYSTQRVKYPGTYTESITDVDLHRELEEKNRRSQRQWQNDDSGEDEGENNNERSDMGIESDEKD